MPHPQQLLSPGGSTRPSATPTKPVQLSPVVTPTANLKLLTGLAASVSAQSHTSAQGHTSASQTLLFEDVDPARYSHEPAYVPPIHPHKDHNYDTHHIVPNNDHIKLEVEDQENNAETSKNKKKSFAPYLKKSRSMQAQLPPLPLEADLFTAPVGRATRKEKSLCLLAEKMLGMFPTEALQPLEIYMDDTAKNLNTERRRIYDIVNVFEAVQIMSKVKYY